MIILLAFALLAAFPTRLPPTVAAVAARRAERAYGYYDTHLERVVLVGGPMNPGRGARDRVWSWSGTRWELVTDSGPPGRVNAAAAFEPLRRRAVLLAGARRAADDSTWEVVGEGWEATTAAVWRRGPDAGPRDHHALVDDGRGGVLLFGGIPAARAGAWPGDTWVLRDDRWERVATTGPSGRARAALVRDGARGQVVLFGGVSAPVGPEETQTFFGDTWTWDGARWRRAAPGGPPGRYAHAMVYDARARVVLLYGGSAAHAGAPLTDMWQWDGARWTAIPSTGPNPGFRYQPVMVYDRARGRTVLYGGLQGGTDETWEWDGRRWHAIAP